MEHYLCFDVNSNKMRILNIILFLLFSQLVLADNLSGFWQGVMIPAGQNMDAGSLLYVYINGSEGEVSGLMRDEQFDSEYFAVKQTDFSLKTDALSFKQIVISKNKKNSSLKWCRMNGELTYDSKTGYLSGSFTSTDCKRVSGTIILYKADGKLEESEESPMSQIWFEPFIKDYREGLSAPKIRDQERKNFKFEPVFFDYDKAEIRDEHRDFLDRMIKVVKGHSDLRVKVVGHTDSDGSDIYNDDLSKRRAEAIVQYFVEHGLKADRLEFDFKGERNPKSTNATPEGKQLNRRVDFSFI